MTCLGIRTVECTGKMCTVPTSFPSESKHQVRVLHRVGDLETFTHSELTEFLTWCFSRWHHRMFETHNISQSNQTCPRTWPNHPKYCDVRWCSINRLVCHVSIATWHHDLNPSIPCRTTHCESSRADRCWSLGNAKDLEKPSNVSNMVGGDIVKILFILLVNCSFQHHESLDSRWPQNQQDRTSVHTARTWSWRPLLVQLNVHPLVQHPVHLHKTRWAAGSVEKGNQGACLHSTMCCSMPSHEQSSCKAVVFLVIDWSQ